MDIKKIINEEVNEWLDEALNLNRTPFPWRKQSDTRYVFDVHVPDFYENPDGTKRDYNVEYDVSFGSGGGSENGYSIIFGDGGYGDTNVGEPMRIMQTVSDIVKDFVANKNPDILNFSPSRTAGDRRRGAGTNRRLDLYKYFVEKGAGGEYEAFTIGNKEMMTVEKTNPSFELVNGQQPFDTVQDIVKDLSYHKGWYETEGVPKDSPDYKIFSVSDYSGFFKSDGSGRQERTISARKFVDWLLSEEDVQYVDASMQRNQQQQAQADPNASPDAPIQRVGARRDTGVAEMGTFQHFLNNHIYGFPDFRDLQPFFDTHKTMEKFDELKTTTEQQMWSADEANRGRLQGIIDAINSLKRAYDDYGRQYRLNEIEENLLDLIK